MSSAIHYYDRTYLDRVLRPLLADDDYYRTKARCAAETYFGRFDRPLGPVLEYGCGIGQNIAAVPGAVGFDVNVEAVTECRRRGVEALRSRSSIPSRHFRYVLCRHVLEHVERPLERLCEMLSYLRDDGLLILVLPREEHALAGFTPDVNRHLYCWNFRAINNLIWQAGGQAEHNRYEPMFGHRTHLPLRPLLKWCGLATYHHCARWIGRCVAAREMVIHARPRRDKESRTMREPTGRVATFGVRRGEGQRQRNSAELGDDQCSA